MTQQEFTRIFSHTYIATLVTMIVCCLITTIDILRLGLALVLLSTSHIMAMAFTLLSFSLAALFYQVSKTFEKPAKVTAGTEEHSNQYSLSKVEKFLLPALMAVILGSCAMPWVKLPIPPAWAQFLVVVVFVAPTFLSLGIGIGVGKILMKRGPITP